MTPDVDHSGVDRFIDHRAELIAAHREELGAMVETSVADASGCEPASDAPTLVDHDDRESCLP